MSSDFYEQLFRPEILDLKPYSPRPRVADDIICLDANENPWTPAGGQPGSRFYSEQQPSEMRSRLAGLYGVQPENCMMTRGADEAIEILIRATCRPGIDSVVITPPTFVMYKIAAQIQGANVVEVPLDPEFELDVDATLGAVQSCQPKLVFLCTPGNPTGRCIETQTILQLVTDFPGTLFVVDEAYIEFTDAPSLTSQATATPNLCVLRTLSKAYGMAGARVGTLVGTPELVQLLLRVLPPFPICAPVVNETLNVLSPANMSVHAARIIRIREERNRMAKALGKSPYVTKVWPSQGNFFLLAISRRSELMQALSRCGILVRDFAAFSPDWIRIAVGSPEQNDLVLQAFGVQLKTVSQQRTGQVSRKTRETDISVLVELDRPQAVQIDTRIGFYDHMLEQVARHGNFGLTLTARGDLHIDPHHTVEDSALALGQAISEALGDRRGIGRYGFALPMDEAQANVVVDLSGRPALRYDVDFRGETIGEMPTEMIEHVFESLSQSLRAAIHVKADGDNDHHIAEGVFKAFGRALRPALTRSQSEDIPSTKGMLV